MVFHPLYSFVHLLKSVILIGLELAHCAVIGVDWDLFFVTDIEKCGRLLHNLNLSQLSNVDHAAAVRRTRLDKPSISCSL